jgi:phosphate-selective porin
MRILTAALAATLLAGTAMAQTAGAPASDAVKVVLEKGLIIDMMGMPIDMMFKADGSFAAMQGAFPGKYRVDGKKVCLTSDAMPEESCIDIPDGKKSGDTFNMTLGQLGETTAKIQ